MNIKIKKTLAVILCLVLSLSLFVVSAAAMSGAGTQASPYQITSESDLIDLAEQVKAGDSFSGKYVVVTKDISLKNELTPIGTKDAPFSGIFDGGDKTISVPSYYDDYAGLFGYVKNAQIKNVVIKDGDFDADSYVGGIAAYAVNSSIDNCHITGKTYLYASNYLGGIVGFAQGGSITNCTTATSSAVIGSDYTGGIAGSSSAAISACTNNASVDGRYIVGGIAGEITGASITKSINNGTVEAGTGNCGGIAGVSTSSNISYSCNTAAITDKGTYSAGVVGSITGGSISNCYNTGAVATSSTYSAGIFGSSDSAAKVTNCYNTGAAKYGIGGDSKSTNKNIYWLNTSASAAFANDSGSNTNCSSLTAAQMKVASNYSGFDFTNDWEIATIHSVYPILKAVDHTYSFLSSTAPTCTKKGFDSYVCGKCGSTTTVDTLDMVSHSVTKLVSTVPATCTQPGTKTYGCENCTYTKTEPLEATGHIDNNKDGVCDDCDAGVPVDSTNEEKELTFWEKIVKAFQDFFNWIKSLFTW